jgi:hypothetical protein
MTYSSRGTNSLDPRQFNGYATAAGSEPRASSTFNPRFSVLGLASHYVEGDQQVDARVEVDFYSTDAANLITPRLRLAYLRWTKENTSATVGMDWLPVASLLPGVLDFSILGYSGNLWQRIPQVTVRRSLGKHWEILGTVFRFERGFTLEPVRPDRDPFNDPVRMPYVGMRIAYQNWGVGERGLVAVSGAYRKFTFPGAAQDSVSDLAALEWVVPIRRGFHWSGKFAHGQGLGDEFFRFGQAFNGTRPIRTNVGWTELSYARQQWSFSGGFGNDRPLARDLRGISNDTLNYRRNERVFTNAVYDAFAHVKLGLEYNFLRTGWTNGALFHGHQVMATVFYSFGQEEK